MANMTDYLENAIAGHVLGATTMTKPATLWVALFTATPSDAGGGTEVSGTAYVRRQFTFNIASGVATNAATIEWPAAGASWGTITHWAIFDASLGGNMLFHGALTASRTIGAADIFRIQASQISITFN